MSLKQEINTSGWVDPGCVCVILIICLQDDYRFKDRFSKQNPRKVIHMWAEKEMHNLVKMSKGGVR